MPSSACVKYRFAKGGRAVANKMRAESPLIHQWNKNWFYIITLAPAVLFILSFFLIILVKLVIFSFTHYSGGKESGATIQNYIDVFSGEDFYEAYLRTLVFVLIVTPAQLVTGFITASLINKGFRGRGVIRGILVSPLTLPSLVTASIFYILFSKGGHINLMLLGQYDFFPKVMSKPISFVGDPTGSFVLTTIVKIWRDTPASMLILLSGMQSLDLAQDEAAMTMGATKIQRVFYITVPALIPSIASVLTLRSIEAWKEFVFPYFLSPSYPLLSVLVDEFYNVQRNPGLAAVVGVVLIVSIMIFNFILKFLLKLVNRYLVKV